MNKPFTSVNAYLKAQYAVGPHLPNAFECVRNILDSVAIKLTVELDPDAEPWDKAWGARGKSECYMLDVEAQAIALGKTFEGHTYLGSSWDTTDDMQYWINHNCHGYLPQMLQEALTDVLADVTAAGVDGLHPSVQQIRQANEALDWLMQVTYAEQRRLYAYLEKDAQGYYVLPAPAQ